MPSVSKKQERFMQAVANNPAFAKKVGVPTSVGREFTKGSKMKKAAKKPMMMEAGGVKKQMPNPKQMGSLGMKSGGKVKKYAGGGLMAGHKSADGIATKGKTKGKQVAMKKGGMCK